MNEKKSQRTLITKKTQFTLAKVPSHFSNKSIIYEIGDSIKCKKK